MLSRNVEARPATERRFLCLWKAVSKHNPVWNVRNGSRSGHQSGLIASLLVIGGEPASRSTGRCYHAVISDRVRAEEVTLVAEHGGPGIRRRTPTAAHPAVLTRGTARTWQALRACVTLRGTGPLPTRGEGCIGRRALAGAGRDDPL